MSPRRSDSLQPIDLGLAVTLAAAALATAVYLGHGDLVGDGPRFQRLLRTSIVCEHPLYLPLLRLLLWAGTPWTLIPEQAMRLLSHAGAAMLAAGTCLVARSCTERRAVATLVTLATAASTSILYHGSATELHGLHGGCAALLLARTLWASAPGVTGLDHFLVILVAGTHSSGIVTGPALLLFRASRAATVPPGAWRRLRQLLVPVLCVLPAAAAPLVGALLLERELVWSYLVHQARQGLGEVFPRVPLVQYLWQEIVLPAPGLVAAGALGLLLTPHRVAVLLVLLCFALVFGPIGIPEEGGYFVALLPVWALLATTVAERAGRLGLPLLLLVLTTQVMTARPFPAPGPSAAKIEHRARVALLPPHTLLILYVPWEASRATQDYLWEVHDPTRDNTALYDRDPEDILAPEFRADPRAALLARVRAHRAAGRPVFMIDPAPFAAMATAGTAALAALAREFATSPAGPALPGLVRLQ